MNSPSQGAWECRHGIDGRDWCEECFKPRERAYTGPIHDYTISVDGSPFTFEYRSQSPDVADIVEEIRFHFNFGNEAAIRVVQA